jgi:hypothetical protein
MRLMRCFIRLVEWLFDLESILADTMVVEYFCILCHSPMSFGAFFMSETVALANQDSGGCSSKVHTNRWSLFLIPFFVEDPCSC